MEPMDRLTHLLHPRTMMQVVMEVEMVDHSMPMAMVVVDHAVPMAMVVVMVVVDLSPMSKKKAKMLV